MAKKQNFSSKFVLPTLTHAMIVVRYGVYPTEALLHKKTKYNPKKWTKIRDVTPAKIDNESRIPPEKHHIRRFPDQVRTSRDSGSPVRQSTIHYTVLDI